MLPRDTQSHRQPFRNYLTLHLAYERPERRPRSTRRNSRLKDAKHAMAQPANDRSEARHTPRVSLLIGHSLQGRLSGNPDSATFSCSKEPFTRFRYKFLSIFRIFTCEICHRMGQNALQQSRLTLPWHRLRHTVEL